MFDAFSIWCDLNYFFRKSEKETMETKQLEVYELKRGGTARSENNTAQLRHVTEDS